MGNRAVLEFEECPGIGIYLHWHGGRDSIEAFVEYCHRRGFRGDDYGVARLTQVIANTFGGDLSVGVAMLDQLDCDNRDNGVYKIRLEDWTITGRRFFKGKEQRFHDREELIRLIDSRQPENDRLYKEEGESHED